MDEHLLNEVDHSISLEKKIIKTPLQFKNDISTSDVENIILIHDEVQDYNNFVINTNDKSFSIVYNLASTKEDLLKLLREKFTKIKRIAFIFHNSFNRDLKLFLDYAFLFTEEDLKATDITSYSPNLSFIIDLVKEFNIEHLDYLACNTLNYTSWKEYYNILQRNCNVIVGASNDETGNLKYGGD